MFLKKKLKQVVRSRGRNSDTPYLADTYYDSSKEHFIFPLEVTSKTIRLSSTSNTCREVTCSSFKSSKRFYPKPLTARVVTLWKKGVLVEPTVWTKSGLDKLRRNTAAACRILNILEKSVGWKQTKCCEVIPERKADRNVMFYFEGSPKWVYGPPMLSLYTWIIRTSQNYGAGKITGDIKSFDDVVRLFRNDAYGSSARNNGRWPIMLRCHSQIFGDASVEDVWRSIKIGHIGFHMFCNVNLSNRYSKKFADLLKTDKGKALQAKYKDIQLGKGSK